MLNPEKMEPRLTAVRADAVVLYEVAMG